MPATKKEKKTNSPLEKDEVIAYADGRGAK
jgi:hypothetical protein